MKISTKAMNPNVNITPMENALVEYNHIHVLVPLVLKIL